MELMADCLGMLGRSETDYKEIFCANAFDVALFLQCEWIVILGRLETKI